MPVIESALTEREGGQPRGFVFLLVPAVGKLADEPRKRVAAGRAQQ